MNPTPEELGKEWLVTYETRLGMSCEDREPNEARKWEARQEADQHIADLKIAFVPREINVELFGH